MRSFKKKPPKNPLYKPGDIFLFERDSFWEDKKEYELVLILDVWRIRLNYYRILTLKTRNGGWISKQIEEFKEIGFKGYYFNNSYMRQVPEDEKLKFLVCYGSPYQCLKETFDAPQFRHMINMKIRRAQEALEKWQDINVQIGQMKKKLEVEYENGKNSDSQSA